MSNELHVPLGLLTKHLGLRESYRRLESLATTDIPILIMGETGVGKEVTARAIHNHSKRSSGPFRVVHCAGVPDTLLEAELFGATKGSYTGATETRTGSIAQGHHGTVFLDEIGDMPYSLQPKILRVLEERCVWPLGASKATAIDVRFIAATNTYLPEAIADGRFRSDLYYRICGELTIIPPLRDRVIDIATLAIALDITYCRNLFDAISPGLTDSAIAWLQAQPWPGNVREMQFALLRGRKLAGLTPIEPEHLLSYHATVVTNNIPADLSMKERMVIYEKTLIVDALNQTGGDMVHAAKKLRVNRTTLYEKTKRYGLRGVG